MTIQQFVTNLANVLVQPLITLLFVIALVVFLWGVFQYIKSADSSDGREQGRNHILWGIIGMFIMSAAFSIIQVAYRTVWQRDAPLNQGQYKIK